jgi:[acyl-carrier-protein] S-malonyltransferase
MNKSLAVVFPGQGSQTVGMLAQIATEFPMVEKVFAEASAALGYDLWKLTQQGPVEELDKTMHTQPALLAASYAIWQILQAKKNFQLALLAGHSLGEYSALVCANAIPFVEGVRLVAARGQFMQDAAPVGTGGLAAIVGLDNADVQTICEKSALAGEVLSPANFNCPGQVVIAGHLPAVERALILAKEAGAKLAKLLPVSVSSHCILMKPAAEKLAALLATTKIQTPTIPIVSNVDVKIYDSADAIRDGLIRQLYMPVRWVETIEFFAKNNISSILECGPGKVLSGLNKRIVPEIQLMSTNDFAGLQMLLTSTLEIQ